MTQQPLLPLMLGVRRKPDAEAISSGKGSARQQAEAALVRDGRVCRCCGFHAHKFARVVPGDVVGSRESFVTVCLFCEQTVMLEKVSVSGGGVLIWLPEFSQKDLHHLMRAIYVARNPQSGAPQNLAQAAHRAFDLLLSRRIEAKRALGSDDPLLLATAMQENLGDRDYAARQAKLDGLRFMPFDRFVVRMKNGTEENRFEDMVASWTMPGGAFHPLPIESWERLFDRVSAG